MGSDSRFEAWRGMYSGSAPRRVRPGVGRPPLAAGAARTVVWFGGNGNGCAHECDAGLGRASSLLDGAGGARRATADWRPGSAGGSLLRAITRASERWWWRWWAMLTGAVALLRCWLLAARPAGELSGHSTGPRLCDAGVARHERRLSWCGAPPPPDSVERASAACLWIRLPLSGVALVPPSPSTPSTSAAPGSAL